MTTHFTSQLSEFLDEELPGEMQAQVASHLEACPECRATLEELRRVSARAKALAAEESGADQWPAIAARLKRSGAGAAPAQAIRHRITFSLPQLAMAASLLVLVASGATWLAVHRGRGAELANTPPVTSPSLQVSTPVQPAGLAAGKDYDDAVAELRQVLEKGRTRLDSNTVVVLERSLASIDRAIAQAEQALAADPGNAYLSGHLAHTRLRKLDLLHRAATLTSARS
jgi:anti-sigma factor RsiW